MSKFHWLKDLQEYLDAHDNNLISVNESIMDYNVTAYIEQRQCPGFSEKLFYFVDSKSLNDTEVYKRAGLDRKLFSKIRSNPAYQPQKKTAFVLCISLQLSLDESKSLLCSAGYTFSNSHLLDLIVQYCIEHEIYNLYEVNFALNQYGLEPI